MDLLYFIGGGSPLLTLLYVGTFFFSIYAQMKVQSAFRTYSRIPNARQLTGMGLAASLKNSYSMEELSIEGVQGTLSDHYNPKTKSLGLSREVAEGASVAALAIVAHEMGHARQDAESMPFLRFRNAVFPLTNIASNAALPIFLLGFWLGAGNLMDIGILLFGIVALFYLVTLPIEVNASKRGLAMLAQGGYLQGEEELRGARHVLQAAALTYIAALASSVVTVLRLLFLRSRR